LGTLPRSCLYLLLVAAGVRDLSGQQALTWEQIKERFQIVNPTLRAGQIGIQQSKAQEVTAYLRPNPALTLSADQFEPFSNNPFRPFASVLNAATFSYLHERQHKRELRRESAVKGTEIAVSQQADLNRTLLFMLHSAFVQALQAKAVLAVAKENIAQYDRVLALNRERQTAGDISEVDLNRLELQRIQFEGDLQTADVNQRTAKIQLLTLLNDRSPVDQFEISGPFDFPDQMMGLEELRSIALQARPDLQAALETISRAETDHRLAIANGSTDPTFGFDYGRNPPLVNYLGFFVSVPLRIFDKNQGEKARTDLEIQRTARLQEVTRAQVFSDVDSAFATVNNTITLLRPYKAKYLATATKVRDTINYAYTNGASSLLDFLQAQQEYRAVQVSYLNLIGAYQTAAGQLNQAVGREPFNNDRHYCPAISRTDSTG